MTPTVDFALESSMQIQGDALFARNRTVRRQLRRWWVADPKRWIAWLMLNPSHATENRNDPTALRVSHFSRSWGYDGWIAVNLYPFIASDPREMWIRADWENNGPDYYARDDLQSNLRDIEQVGRAACLRMVAFGAAPIERDQPWMEQCIEAFSQPSEFVGGEVAFDERLFCLGKTIAG